MSSAPSAWLRTSPNEPSRTANVWSSSCARSSRKGEWPANLRAVIEELPIGVVVTREGCMLFFNLAATSCLRWSDAKAYLGLELGQFVSEASREKLRGQPDGSPALLHLGEMQITTGDHATITAEVQSVGIEFDGFPARLLSIRDVTDLRRMEQDLHQAQRLESIGRLAAGIAHEINTPIQFIGDNAQFLAQGIADVLAYLALCEELLQAPEFEAQRASLAERKEQLDVSFVHGRGAATQPKTSLKVFRV